MKGAPHIVFVVDDQPMLIQFVRGILGNLSDFSIHNQSDPNHAIERASEISPTVIVLSLDLPDRKGFELLGQFRSSPITSKLPVAVMSSNGELMAEAYSLGATDFFLTLPDDVELVTRLKHHSNSFLQEMRRQQAYTAIAENRKQMAAEMDAAVRFLESLFPKPITQPLLVDWRYVPSHQVGGDAFGYDRLDDGHFRMFILDVMGHGLPAAFLSFLIMNVLRSRALPDTDFRCPDQVLAALNKMFPFEDFAGKFITIWYGVFCFADSTLAWSSGGHHPQILLETGKRSRPILLGSNEPDPAIGLFPDQAFQVSQKYVNTGSRLYLFTDGVWEIERPTGEMGSHSELVSFIAEDQTGSVMDLLLIQARNVQNSAPLRDDFTLVEFRF